VSSKVGSGAVHHSFITKGPWEYTSRLYPVFSRLVRRSSTPEFATSRRVGIIFPTRAKWSFCLFTTSVQTYETFGRFTEDKYSLPGSLQSTIATSPDDLILTGTGLPSQHYAFAVLYRYWHAWGKWCCNSSRPLAHFGNSCNDAGSRSSRKGHPPREYMET